jgi:L-rhamnose-H+ transport protein
MILVLSGTLGGSVMAPIKAMRKWHFEKSWALYSVWAYLIFPWVAALLTIPHLLGIFPELSSRTMLICALCGMGWGIAVVLSGISVKLIGISLTTTILYGASIAVGSLAPLVISHRERIISKQGMWIVLADAGIISGVLFCTWAGKVSDKNRTPKDSEAAFLSSTHGHFSRGIIAAFLAAFLSSLFNIALAYGGEFNRLAIARGASPLNAANALWAFTVTFGYLPNVSFTIYSFSRRRLWNSLSDPPIYYWFLPTLMGLMFMGGTILYGSGAGLLGAIGPVLGWPIYMSVSIMAGVFWGYVTGEWHGAPRRALVILASGILLQSVFILVLAAIGQ